MMPASKAVEVDGLTIDYETGRGRVRAVDAVSFSLAPSEILGLVGESGSGKSTVAMALLGHESARGLPHLSEVLNPIAPRGVLARRSCATVGIAYALRPARIMTRAQLFTAVGRKNSIRGASL